jgi:hypothetical protein
LTDTLGQQWRGDLGEKGEVPRLLRQMQSILAGTLRMKNRLLSGDN